MSAAPVTACYGRNELQSQVDGHWITLTHAQMQDILRVLRPATIKQAIRRIAQGMGTLQVHALAQQWLADIIVECLQ